MAPRSKSNDPHPGGHVFGNEVIIQSWVDDIVCPVHNQHPRVAIRDGKVGLVKPCCEVMKQKVAQELGKHWRSSSDKNPG